MDVLQYFVIYLILWWKRRRRRLSNTFKQAILPPAENFHFSSYVHFSPYIWIKMWKFECAGCVAIDVHFLYLLSFFLTWAFIMQQVETFFVCEHKLIYHMMLRWKLHYLPCELLTFLDVYPVLCCAVIMEFSFAFHTFDWLDLERHIVTLTSNLHHTIFGKSHRILLYRYSSCGLMHSEHTHAHTQHRAHMDITPQWQPGMAPITIYTKVLNRWGD